MIDICTVPLISLKESSKGEDIRLKKCLHLTPLNLFLFFFKDSPQNVCFDLGACCYLFIFVYRSMSRF